MRTILATMLATVALGGCDCAYGGPGCGDPQVTGLCAPIVQVEVPTVLEVDYGDDTGLHPAAVSVMRISDPTVIGVWPGATLGSLTVLGLASGSADVELKVAGWERPRLVPFQVTPGPAPTCSVEPGDGGPSFPIAITAP
jgi:hypothetical protein